ncbi:IS200/IS605 family transposase [Microbispora amethystogenes]|uniref:IS200/IS605 family transposase n=1 Tax=Microbispora amethystogenes TaxID=1427754 RepID=UPI00337B2CA6
MADYREISELAGSPLFVLHAHVVVVTTFRHRTFTGAHLERTEQIMRDVWADFECELAKFTGAANHVHLLVNLPPKVALSRLVNSVKRGVLPADVDRVPRTGPPLLPGEQAVVGFLTPGLKDSVGKSANPPLVGWWRAGSVCRSLPEVGQCRWMPEMITGCRS